MDARRKKWMLRLGIPLGILMLIFLLRYPILRGIGHWLIVEDALQESDAIYVLSGGPATRSVEAAEIQKAGWADTIWCTGQEVSIPGNPALCIDSMCTGEVTRRFIIAENVDSAKICLLVQGTSTYEEYLAIRAHAKQRGYRKVIVVSSEFHTRRMRNVFHGGMEEAGIGVVIRGAKESDFDPDHWWTQEAGLLNVFNEYVKMVYYFFKY